MFYHKIPYLAIKFSGVKKDRKKTRKSIYVATLRCNIHRRKTENIHHVIYSEQNLVSQLKKCLFIDTNWLYSQNDQINGPGYALWSVMPSSGE